MRMPHNTEQDFLHAYDAYADAIFRHCYFRVFSRERAKELSQEAFLKTWEYLASGKEVENLRAFLYRVATNLIIDESRKKKSNSIDELSERGFDPPATRGAGAMEDISDGKFAMEMLRTLDRKYRDAILLRYVDDLTPKEIAGILGENENTVSVWIHRGLIELRKRFLS